MPAELHIRRVTAAKHERKAAEQGGPTQGFPTPHTAADPIVGGAGSTACAASSALGYAGTVLAESTIVGQNDGAIFGSVMVPCDAYLSP